MTGRTKRTGIPRKVTKVLLGLAAGVVMVAGGAVAASAADPSPAPSPAPSPFLTPAPSGAPAPSASPAPVAGPTPSPPPLAVCDAQGHPTKSGVGVEGLIQLPCLRGNDPPTQFEQYPSSAYQIHTGSNAVSNVFNGGFTFVAGFLFGWVTAVGTFCAAMIEWAFSLQLVSGVGSDTSLAKPLDAFMATLQARVYQPFIFVALGVVAIYITWFGVLRRRTSVIIESIGWVLIASVVAALFFARPSWIVGTLDTYSQSISNGIMQAISSSDGTSPGPGPGAQGGDYVGLRQGVSRYWQVYAYEPWLVTEFGSLDVANTTQDSVPSQCKKYQPPRKGLTYIDWDLEANASGQQSQQDTFSSNYDGYLDCTNQTSAKAWYDGGVGVQRMMVAILALITVTIVSVLLILISGAILIAQIGMVVMTMVAPLFFLVAVIPGTGRQIFIRWGEVLLGFLVRKILYSAFLSIILVVGGIIITGFASTSWFLASVLQIGLVVAAFLYRKPFAAMFKQLGAGHLDQHLAPHRERLGRWGLVGAGALGEGVRDSWKSGVARLREGPTIPFNERVAREYLAGDTATEEDEGGEGVAAAAGATAGKAATGAAAGAASGGFAGAAAGAATGAATEMASFAKRKVTRMVNIPGGVMVDSWEEGVGFKGSPDDVRRQHRDSVMAPDYVNDANDSSPRWGEPRKAAWQANESRSAGPSSPTGPKRPNGAALVLHSNGDVQRLLPPSLAQRRPSLPPRKEDDE